MDKIFYCPSCKTVPVTRKLGSGKTPRCAICKIAARDSKHYDKNGVRYGTPGRVIIRTCKYCFTEYERRKRGEPVEAACEKCLSVHKKIKADNHKAMIPFFPYAQPERRFVKRLERKLEKSGLAPDWYDKQPKVCGICATDNPGRKGRWHIDHDHRCCPSPKRGAIVGCSKCIRGLLCIRCNMALGLLKDSPEILRAAIRWLEKKPVKLF
jgi:hypothetical protein